MAKPYPLKFAPIAQERIWGGDKLKTWFSIPPLDGQLASTGFFPVIPTERAALSTASLRESR